MTDTRWQRLRDELLTYPCELCGAVAGDECVTVFIPNRTHPENVGKPTAMPHAARHRLHSKDHPPAPYVPTPPATRSPQVLEAIELLRQCQRELAVYARQIDAALRYLTAG